MSGLKNRKRKWLSGLSAIAFAIAPVCVIPAEEDSETADQYLIVELAPVLISELDNAGVEQTSQVDSAVFSLQESMDTDAYRITGIHANEPIIAQFLAQTKATQAYDTVSVYEIISYQQTADESDKWYEFNLQIPTDAAITLYQSAVDGKLQKNTLEASYTEEKYNRLPQIQYSSETNHWLVLHLGIGTDETGVNTEDAASESAAESLEGKTDSAAEETSNSNPNSQTTEASQSSASQTKPEIPSTTAPTTSTPTTASSTAAPTTAHVHAWVPVTNVVHYEATYKDVWVQDAAAWDETVVTKEAWDETVLVQEAYDEQVLVSDAYDEPIYDWVDICNECGHKFFDPSDDINEHMAAGCWSGWHAERMQVGTTHHDAVYQMVHHDAVYQTIHHAAETTVIHHDAVGHTEKAIDQAAWDETVIVGYTCSGCGATKEN